ncbi:MAG: diaminopimelate epimerase [Candidatus Hadarchaeota archaeon]
MQVVKMHGLGNSQLVIEDIENCLEEKTGLIYGEMAEALCNQGFGIGADQMLVILPSITANYKMRIFNKDGGEAEMCGNGIRCVAKYLYDKNKVDKEHTIETKAGIKELKIHESPKKDQIEVKMGEGKIIEDGITVNEFKGTFVSTGNPHFVTFTRKASTNTARVEGPKMEKDEIFQPDGANIEFAYPPSNSEIETYVWERGAGLTLACGTGACATAFVARKKGMIPKSSKIRLLGGTLEIKVKENGIIYMTGPAEYILRGTVDDISGIHENVEKYKERRAQ